MRLFTIRWSYETWEVEKLTKLADYGRSLLVFLSAGNKEKIWLGVPTIDYPVDFVRCFFGTFEDCGGTGDLGYRKGD